METEDKLLEIKLKSLSEVLRLYFTEENFPRLRGRTFMVWSALLSEAIPVVGITSISHGRIMSMTGIRSKATVARAFGELIEKGYLRVLEVGGPENQPRVYQLLHHRFAGADAVVKHGRISDNVCAITENGFREFADGVSESLMN